MFRVPCVLWLVVLTVGLINAWDIAVGHGELLDFYANETKIDTVRIQAHNIAALTYDEVHNTLMYVDKQSGNDAICGFDITFIESKCFTERNSKNIHGLSFDPATQLLFFTDTNERTINWISLKSGSKNNVFGNLLIKVEHGIPTDIAVDSCRGYVYWINTNLTTPTIERARFNGSEREVLISTKSFSLNKTYQLEPHSLTIDQQTQRMYWIEPRDSSTYHVHYTDLNGKNETHFCRLFGGSYYNPSSNIISISKTSLYVVFWTDVDMYAEKLTKINFVNADKKRFDLKFKNAIVGIAANYKIKERIQGIDNCEALTSLELNNCDAPVCVHGVKVIGQSLCKCSPGYIGDRCDVSVCNNYCMQGNCSISSDGLPECRCNAGYTGDRCEVDLCHGFCLNSGECYLNEEAEPSCDCVGYEGPRCEIAQNDKTASENIPMYTAGTNLTLADLLASFRKPKILLIVDGA